MRTGDRHEVERRVIRIVDTKFNGPRISVTPETRLISDLRLTSADIFDLTVYLKEEFNIQIGDNEVVGVIAAVDGLIDLVRRKVDPI